MSRSLEIVEANLLADVENVSPVIKHAGSVVCCREPGGGGVVVTAARCIVVVTKR